MNMSTMIKLLILCSIIATATSLSCMECPADLVCDPLPESEECFSAYAPCSCCPTCAGRFGDKCSGMHIRCHPDFVCVNENGEELAAVPWYLFNFDGFCIRERCPKPSTGGGPIIVGK